MKMHWNFEVVISAFVAFFASGVVLLVLDRKYGEVVYRFGFDWTHRDPLPENVEVGFLEGHVGLRNRLGRGFWISTIGILLPIYFGHESFLNCLIAWLVGIPSAALGLKAGPVLGRIFDHRGEYIAKVESAAGKISETAGKVRSGEISLKPDLGAASDAVTAVISVAAANVVDAAKSAKDSVMERLPDFGSKPEEEVKPLEVQPEVPKESEQEKKDRLFKEAQATIDNYTGKSS